MGLLASAGWGALPTPVSAAPAAAGPLSLTPAERAWLKEHPTIRVGLDPGWPPFSMADKKGGVRGIGPDLLARLSRELGVAFVPVTRAGWPAVYEAARRREIDVLGGTSYTEERAKDFAFTEPYFSFPVVVVMRNDEPLFWSPLDLNGRTVVGVRAYAPTLALQKQYPEFKYVLADTVREAMEMVMDRRADALVTNLPNASFVAKTRGLTDLKIAGVMPQTFDLRYAVRPDWPELVAILDRAIAGLTEADRQALVHPWIRIDYASVIRWDVVWKSALGVFVVLGLALGAVIYHSRRLARELAERIQLQSEVKAANEELTLLNEEKTELLQMAAHDLRGPLTGMQLVIDSALRLEAIRKSEALQMLEKQVKQMTALLGDLLDVEALEGGRRDFRFEAVNPAAQIREVLAMTEPAAGRKSIRIEAEGLDGVCPGVHADPTALRQIADNLLSNAIKFSPRGSTVTVRMRRQEDGFVRFEVCDQGPGVPPGETERIFAKYARGSAVPTAGEKSTGLGLSIVRQLATAMNGRVWCENSPGRGAMFVVTVPLAGTMNKSSA